jgi:hypothetical protein
VKLAEFWWDWSKCCGIKKGMARDGARGIGWGGMDFSLWGIRETLKGKAT